MHIDSAGRTAAPPGDAGVVQVGLLWHSLRNENLGVGALTIAHMAILERAAERAGRRVSFRVIGASGRLHYPPPGAAVDEVEVGGFRELVPGSSLWKALRSCDIVMDNGGGDSFTDLYGPHRFLRLVMTKEVALACGKPLLLSPQTIGPFRKRWAIMEASRLVRAARHVFARDAESMQALEGLGCRTGVQTVDVAFRLPFERQPRAENGTIRYGLNVSALMLSGGYSGSNQFGLRIDYPAFVDALIAMLSAMPNVKVVLVPHVLAEHMPVEDDYAASLKLAERFPGVEVAPRFRSPSEAKSFISGLHVLAGSRMHATIAALSSGVAVVPLAYSRKFRGVFQSVDYPVVGDCTAHTAEELLEMCRSAAENWRDLQAKAEASNRIGQAKLDVYEDVLTECLAGL